MNLKPSSLKTPRSKDLNNLTRRFYPRSSTLCVFASLRANNPAASYLPRLDDLITAQSAKLSALKTHRKALMQQLFPSPEESL